jgi:enoyl-CoA hydratase/carnithine racemase
VSGEHEQVEQAGGGEEPARPLVRLETAGPAEGAGESPVVIVRLDNPKINALSTQLLAQLSEIADELHRNPPGAVVVWGGERIFAAGADISEFGGPDRAAEVAAAFHGALDRLASVPRPTIAAIAGYALGGGLEVALACDFRVVAENAKLGQPEILLGIIPGGGGTQRLARLIGPARAKELIFTGRQVRADEALRIGLADRVVPAGELLERALALAGELAAGAVVAQGLAKKAIDGGLAGELAEGLALERELFRQAFTTEDASIGVASFLESGPGKARFVGR